MAAQEVALEGRQVVLDHRDHCIQVEGRTRSCTISDQTRWLVNGGKVASLRNPVAIWPPAPSFHRHPVSPGEWLVSYC